MLGIFFAFAAKPFIALKKQRGKRKEAIAKAASTNKPATLATVRVLFPIKGNCVHL